MEIPSTLYKAKKKKQDNYQRILPSLFLFLVHFHPLWSWVVDGEVGGFDLPTDNLVSEVALRLWFGLLRSMGPFSRR